MHQSVVVAVTLLGLVLSFTSALVIPDYNAGFKNETRRVLENDTLLLVCNTTVLENTTDFYWIKNNTDRGTSEFFTTGWKVEFFSIKREAHGVFICHAIDNSTGENVTLSMTTVDVQYPAECSSMSLYPRVIMENEKFDVSCSMHGNPEPSWGIYNNDTGVAVMTATASADVTLNGVPVQCGYSGFWVCSGKNKFNHGINATRGYHLSVLCSPRPDPEARIDLEYRSSVHENVSLTMKIQGDPVPNYIWSRDDKMPFGNVVVNEGAKGTTLNIYDVGPEDFGNYTLRMNNSVGSYYAHFTLRASGYPEKPYDFRASNISYDSVDLSWTSGFDMGTKQNFMIAKFTENTFMTISEEISGPYKDGGLGQNWTYHLTGLKSNTEYTLSVLAENAKNWTFSDKIVFNTTAQPPHYPAEQRSSSVGVLAGGIAGGVVLLALVIIIANLVYRKRSSWTVQDKGPLVTPIRNNQYGGTYAVNNEKPQMF